MIEALLLAAYLHRPLFLVEKVYSEGGVDAVAVVEMESRFNPRAWRREPRGHSSWGLFQIDNEWHSQYRGDLDAHIAEGVRILRECEMGGTFSEAIARYNGGTNHGAYSIAWGKQVEAKRDELSRWLWNHEEISGGKL